MLATLVDLLAPVSPPEFFEAFRSRERLHIAASDPTRAETLLSWANIDELLSRDPFDRNVRIMRDGVIIPRQMYTANEGKQFDVRAFHDLLDQGVSIVVDEIHQSIPQIGQLAGAIEREMGIRTQANAYVSFSKGGAFKPHWDTHDVLVVQVHGNKRWRVWNAEVPHPVELAHRPETIASRHPDQEIDVAAGDVLFIPRGEPHSASVSTGCSVHLTIGLVSQTGIDFLDRLRKEAAKVPLLRMDLPRHSTIEETAAHEADIKRELHQIIDAASISEFLKDDDLSRQPALQIAAADIFPGTGDVLRPTLRRRITLPDITPHDGPQLVTIGGERRRLLPASIDILRWLFVHEPATVRALYAGLIPVHGRGSIEIAIRELLRLGLLVVNRTV